MRVMVDTNALIWAVDRPASLTPTAAATIRDPANQLVLSAATVWEISIKVALGKLSLSMPYRRWIETAIFDLGMTILPITIEYSDAQTRLTMHHRDPFDRFLIAQATVERLPIVSSDAQLDQYGVTRIWDSTAARTFFLRSPAVKSIGGDAAKTAARPAGDAARAAGIAAVCRL